MRKILYVEESDVVDCGSKLAVKIRRDPMKRVEVYGGDITNILEDPTQVLVPIFTEDPSPGLDWIQVYVRNGEHQGCVGYYQFT